MSFEDAVGASLTINLRIDLGGDSDNIGIDNVRVSEQAAPSGSGDQAPFASAAGLVAVLALVAGWRPRG
jgi:hypothetical protein